MAAPLAVAAIAAPIIGGIFGSINSAQDRARAEYLMQQALEEIRSVGAPPDLAKALILEKFEQAGMLTPELEQDINLGLSKVGQIQEDPSLRDAQMGALEALTKRGKTGLTPEDRAAYNEIRQRVAADSEGKRQQILQNFMARGQGGSGAELAAQLSASQSGADRMSAEGDRISADASKRALEAMMSSGQLGGQIRGQDFDINRTKASAEDEIAKFNTANAISRQSRNIAARNNAQQYNLAEKQRIQDANIQMRNNELARQADARRNYWLDQLSAAQGRASSYGTGANFAANQGAATAKQWQGIGAGVGAGAGAIYSAGEGKTPQQPMFQGITSPTGMDPEDIKRKQQQSDSYLGRY
jgi:hypothetical protein